MVEEVAMCAHTRVSRLPRVSSSDGIFLGVPILCIAALRAIILCTLKSRAHAAAHTWQLSLVARSRCARMGPDRTCLHQHSNPGGFFTNLRAYLPLVWAASVAFLLLFIACQKVISPRMHPVYVSLPYINQQHWNMRCVFVCVCVVRVCVRVCSCVCVCAGRTRGLCGREQSLSTDWLSCRN